MLSAFIIFIYISYKIRSCFIAFSWILNMIFVYPICLVIYKVFLKITYFGPLQIMSIFVVEYVST